jgi:homopolymeric O-antigen transport system permease protein
MSVLSPRAYWRSAGELVGILRSHPQLTWEMAKREITDKYAGQLLGAFWAVGHPLILIAVYVFIFAFVFQVKIGDRGVFPLDYSTYLLAGLIPWLAFAESMLKTAAVVTANTNLVKQVVFPVEILPVKSVLASFATQLISTFLLVVYVLSRHHRLPWTYALLPVLFVFQLLAMIGVACTLAALGAFFRDLKELVQIFTVVGVYLMPAVYLPDMVPPLFRPLLHANPFSHVAWCYQDACCFGRIEHPVSWLVFPVLAILVFSFGYRVFRKLKPMFGNVL